MTHVHHVPTSQPQATTLTSDLFFSSQIMKIMNSILGEKLFNMLMKSTFYGHFVAGEDQVKIVPTLER